MNKPATNAEQLVAAAARWGIEYIFANLGSDHPAFMEAFARLSKSDAAIPRIVTCPHEMTALSAAHGHAMVSGRPQMVLVHVDVGTQNLGGSVHNAARGRVPAIIIAGRSPVTSVGEAMGSRTEFIHYLQDATRQHDIVSPYVKWAYELRVPQSAEEVLHRALQIATAAPEGPVYVTAAREAFEHPGRSRLELAPPSPPVRIGGLPEDAVTELRELIASSERPIVVTSYLGRRLEAVGRLVALSEQFGIGVIEVVPQYVNFPGDHPHHLGYAMNRLIGQADLILLVDIDVPWIPAVVQPARGARVVHIDIDPLKPSIGYWGFPARPAFQAEAAIALAQLTAGPTPASGRAARNGWIEKVRPPAGTPSPTPPHAPPTALDVSCAVASLIGDETLVVVEAPTAGATIASALRRRRPGTWFANGGSGLGFGINAAIGIKLAAPTRDVVALVGDGSFVFGVPASAYWVARTYAVPFLTVIYNNGGWNAPRHSTLLVHPDGEAAASDQFWSTMTRGANLGAIAQAAGDARAIRVVERGKLDDALREGLDAVYGGRCAVVEVMMEPFSSQVLGSAKPISNI